MTEQPHFKRYRAHARQYAAGGSTVLVDTIERRTGTVVSVGELPLCLHVRNHSPDGFNYGYGGSGPAQLALAIMCDVLKDEERALGLYQGFKWAVIAKLHATNAWEITSDDVMAFVDKAERETA